MTSDKQDADHREPTTATPSSPCVRNCCLDHDDVCLGCFRTLEEIRGWLASDNTEKENILYRCAIRRQARRRPPQRSRLKKGADAP
ncbi:MAG: DUF1289 domain-containing protein [Oceanospirillaceae bacterium]|nr:DUF1289 domain-containing protein [Oceanospirillaceae bacterium]MBT14015.1 DUF1289 domain-containing protein [Oceanospirillaceae bacterium]